MWAIKLRITTTWLANQYDTRVVKCRCPERRDMTSDNPYTPPSDDPDTPRPNAVVLWMSRFVLVTKCIFYLVVLANIGLWSFVLIKAMLHAVGAPPLFP